MHMVSIPIPGAVRSPFCSRTYELLGRRDPSHAVSPIDGVAPSSWAPILMVSDVLEAVMPRPSWDGANEELVDMACAMFGLLSELETIASEVAAFRRWLAAEGLGSEQGIDALEAMVAPATRRVGGSMLEGRLREALRLQGPSRERRLAARRDRKRRRRNAARR